MIKNTYSKMNLKKALLAGKSYHILLRMFKSSLKARAEDFIFAGMRPAILPDCRICRRRISVRIRTLRSHLHVIKR